MRRSLATVVALVTIGGATGASQAAAYVFSPYVDMAAYPPPDVDALARSSGIHETSLGFVTAGGAGRCSPTWGGYGAYPASGHRPYLRGTVRAFQRTGGRVAVSFGGEAGAELATVCPSVAQLRTQYANTLAAYRPSRLDFDIEGAAVADRAGNDRRAAALSALQHTATARHRRLNVSFTLPVLPTGLPPEELELLRDALARGVRLTYVNLMAMDYGDSAAPHPSGWMGTYAIEAARSVGRQLRRFFPHATLADRLRLVGVTPMLGINDVSTETFGLADARQLARFARSQPIGMLSMWELGRDRRCPQPTSTAQINCSGVAEKPYAYARALAP